MIDDASQCSGTQLIGMATLARMAYAGDDFTDLSRSLIERSTKDATDANALLDLSIVLQLAGHRDLGLAVQKQALALSRVFRLPPKSGDSTLSVLVVLNEGDLSENNVVELLLEAADVTLDLCYFASGDALRAVCDDGRHDVVFVAMSQYERNREVLARVGRALDDVAIPVLNDPRRIDGLSRDRIEAVLGRSDRFVVPATTRATRDDLRRAASGRDDATLLGFALPVLVRPIDSHKGIGLAKLDDAAALAAYLDERGETAFYVCPFIDYRSADGAFRKYRVVLIDGVPFLCHLAISSHWMVHYLSAGMVDSDDKRREEAACMASFASTFAVRHAEAFTHIATALGLDYVGLDCGELPDGRLIVFEADSSMTVHAMDPVAAFGYKQPNMRRLFDAFEALLHSRCVGSFTPAPTMRLETFARP